MDGHKFTWFGEYANHERNAIIALAVLSKTIYKPFVAYKLTKYGSKKA
jgi:hypothetical protein